MGNKEGNKEFSTVGGYEKDSRRAKKREEDAKAHHIWYETTGPNVIIRTKVGGNNELPNDEDPFDVSCDDVAHSLNKGRRWEKAEEADQILHKQKSSGKISFVKASVLNFPNTRLICNTLTDHTDDVEKYLEVEDGQLTVRNSKSNRANLTSLQSTAGPGPRLKANRHRNKRGDVDDKGSLSDPSEDRQHTRYSAIEVQKRDPKSVERSWRTCQHQRSQKQGWTRKPASNDDDDWYSEEQEALEDALDEYYEEQLDSKEPLRLPDTKERTVTKHSAPVVKDDEKEEEVEKVELSQETKKKKQEKLLAKMMEEEHREQFIEVRPLLTSSQPEVLVKAKEYFNKMKDAKCLPVFPRTIIVHRGDSKRILGVRMDRCTFIAASNIAGGVNVYAAPRFCCTFTTVALVEGWQSYASNESDAITLVSDPIEPSSSLDECPICKKTEGTEELADIVVVEPLRLFSFSCGHIACHSCWISHAKRISRERATSITCVNPDCTHISSISEAAALFSDGTLDIFRGFSWDALCAQEDSVTCHKCYRLLVPDKTNCSATALCSCGARTCRKCALSDHLPINCSAYKIWAEKLRPYSPFKTASYYYTTHPYRRLVPAERDAFINCGQCGAENAWRWKYWCDKCLAMRWHSEDYSQFSKEDHIIVLEARGKLQNGEYRQVKIDRDVMNHEKSKEMERIIEEGVDLFELIKISRILKEARLSSSRKGKMAREQYEMESSLDSVLFAAMETGEDSEMKVEELEKKIEAIRHEYAQSITMMSLQK